MKAILKWQIDQLQNNLLNLVYNIDSINIAFTLIKPLNINSFVMSASENDVMNNYNECLSKLTNL